MSNIFVFTNNLLLILLILLFFVHGEYILQIRLIYLLSGNWNNFIVIGHWEQLDFFLHYNLPLTFHFEFKFSALFNISIKRMVTIIAFKIVLVFRDQFRLWRVNKKNGSLHRKYRKPMNECYCILLRVVCKCLIRFYWMA